MTGSRRRSHWAWGWADKEPTPEELEKVARRVGGPLGVELIASSAVPIDRATVPPSRWAVPAELAAFCTDDREARLRHTYGRGYPDLVRAFRGDFAHAPDLVATPRDEADVVATLAWANRAGVAVIPFGGGTSVVAGVEPDVGRSGHSAGDADAQAPDRVERSGLGADTASLDPANRSGVDARTTGRYAGTLSLDLSRLDRVLEVDALSRAARIQAGVMGPALEAQLQPHGFTLRHFPQSFEFSSLGGWIATRAGGHFATLYTHIDDLVESVRMVTPTGIWESRRLPASGAGPAPDRLVLGSEGILGVITEAWVRVQPRPTWRASASVRFGDFGAAIAALRTIVQAGLHPANCRVLDPQEAFLNRVVDDGSAVLLLGFESADAPRDAWMARALELAQAHGGVAPDGVRTRAEASARWRDAFFEGPYLLNALVALGVVADTFETACTWDRFEALHEGVCTRMLERLGRVCGGGVVTCRITHAYPDGLAPYFTFVAPGRRGAELEQWAELKAAASDAVLAFGGTITHHHAVGRRHRPGYDRERPEPFARALQAAKAAVDPRGILNPGVLVPPLPGPAGGADPG